MINWKARFRNPIFISQVVLSILAPIIGYLGISYEDLTTWVKLGDVLYGAISNPYVLGLVAVSFYNAVNDPTTAGHSDSMRALNYTKPKKDVK